MSNWNQAPPPPGYPGASGSSGPAWGAPTPPPGANAGWGAPAPSPGTAWGAPAPQQGASDAEADGKKHGAPPMMGGMPPMLPPIMPMRPMGIDPEAQAMAADMAFATTKMRNAFVRKVFGIVTLQLMVTVGVAAACIYVPEVRKTVRAYPGMYYAAWGVAFAVMLVIACFEKARRTFPINVVLLGVFTLAEAFLVGMISAFHNINAVMLAFLVTSAAVGALTLFAINTKIDATKWGSMLLVVTIVLLVLSLIGIFWRQKILYLAISGIAAVLFSAYLVYDIQMMMGGRRSEYGPDDYVFAALSIYLDVINLFTAILSIIGLTSNN